MKRPPSALWLCRKPVGVGSSALVRDFRAEHAGDYRLKVSHGGVLDPFAHGLVVLLVGAANRLFERLHEAPKVYRARLCFGIETATGDAGGAIVRRGDPGGLSPEALEVGLRSFLGWTDQVPPATSNKRVGGERAWQRALRGESFTLPPQRVYCHDARWLEHDLPRGSRLELTVRGGFYVRSLAIDLGRRLGVGAHVVELERAAIGPWSCPPLDRRVAVSGRAVLPWLGSIELDDGEWGRLRRGLPAPERAPLPPEWPLPGGFPTVPWVRALHRERLVAILGGPAPVLLPGGV